MRKLIIIATTLTMIFAFGPTAFATPPDGAGSNNNSPHKGHHNGTDTHGQGNAYGWDNNGPGSHNHHSQNHVQANATSAVFDIQTATGGFVAGGAFSVAAAEGHKKAEAKAGTWSAMDARTYNFSTEGGRGKGVSTYGDVTAQAEANANKRGTTIAIAAGAVIQASGIEIDNSNGTATAQNASEAAFISADWGHKKAEAEGSVTTGGFSEVYSGGVGHTRYTGANTGNFAESHGDFTIAGGSGIVTSTSNQPGAITNGAASFNYTGNYAGNASTYSETTSYTDGGISYKSAYSCANANVTQINNK